MTTKTKAAAKAAAELDRIAARIEAWQAKYGPLDTERRLSRIKSEVMQTAAAIARAEGEQT